MVLPPNWSIGGVGGVEGPMTRDYLISINTDRKNKTCPFVVHVWRGKKKGESSFLKSHCGRTLSKALEEAALTIRIEEKLLDIDTRQNALCSATPVPGKT